MGKNLRLLQGVIKAHESEGRLQAPVVCSVVQDLSRSPSDRPHNMRCVYSIRRKNVTDQIQEGRLFVFGYVAFEQVCILSVFLTDAVSPRFSPPLFSAVVKEHSIENGFSERVEAWASTDLGLTSSKFRWHVCLLELAMSRGTRWSLMH
jgi:hypothetical protein